MTERGLRRTGAVLVLLGVGVIVTLTGCVPREEGPQPSPSPTSLIGLTLLDARPSLPQETIAIYDLSAPILNLDPSYNDGQPQGRWTIVAQCGVGVGVIPTEDYVDGIELRAVEGEFEAMLTECG